MTHAFSSLPTSCPPHFACLPLHLARFYHQVLPPFAVNSESIMVVLAKFWGVQLPSGHKIAKICMPPGGQLSMRKWRDRECTYSAVGLPAFFNDNDIMFPPFFTECWCWMLMMLVWATLTGLARYMRQGEGEQRPEKSGNKTKKKREKRLPPMYKL